MTPLAAASAPNSGVFVNEIHYDNVGVDQNEGIELAGPAGVDLANYSIELYNGYNGKLYGTVTASGILPDQENGYGTDFMGVPGLQNGAPDGLALIGPDGVEETLAYEGSFTAIDGAAAGQSLSDIGRFEAPSTPMGESLQLEGTGNSPADFTWEGPIAATPGQINAGEHFTAPQVSHAPPPDSPPASIVVSAPPSSTSPIGTSVPTAPSKPARAPALMLSHHLAGRVLTLTVTLPKGASSAVTAVLRAYDGTHRIALLERRVTARHHIATVRFELTSRQLHATKISINASAARATSEPMTLTHLIKS
jgi:hypothetical protein